MLSHEQFKRNLRIVASSAILIGGYCIIHNADAATPPRPGSPWIFAEARALAGAYDQPPATLAVAGNSIYCANMPAMIGRAAGGRAGAWIAGFNPRYRGRSVYCATAYKIGHGAEYETVYQLFPFQVVSAHVVHAHGIGVGQSGMTISYATTIDGLDFWREGVSK